ncbi:MAG: hypothetical protein OHK0046_24300 [Anaerolineae bacterium]
MRLRVVWFSLFTLLVMAACAPPQDSVQQPTSTFFPTAPAVARERFTVARGDVVEPLEFTGRWEPRDQVNLGFEVDGEVRQVSVRRGDTVAAGQVIADLQIEELEERLEDLELQLEQALAGQENDAESAVEAVNNAELSLFRAELALQRHLDSPPSASVRSAIRGLEDAQRALQDAEDAYYEALADNGQGGAGAVDGAYEALENARRGVEDAEFSYRESAASAGDTITQWEETRVDLENDVALAQRELEDARSGAGTSDQDTIRTTQIEIDRVREDIARSTLISPIDGVVLEVNVQPGDNVEAFDGVIRVGIPEPREIISQLPIGDAQQLSVGLVGECQVSNRPETRVQCVVRQIPASARDTDQTTRVAASMADLAQADAIIEVEMPLQSRENVLYLPPEAIRTFQNRTFVVLDSPDGGRSVNVEVGLQTDDRVEIISGVNEGDVVLGQ